jgi:hypothetical protein
MARPMPLAAPVTMAVFLDVGIVGSSSPQVCGESEGDAKSNVPNTARGSSSAEEKTGSAASRAPVNAWWRPEQARMRPGPKAQQTLLSALCAPLRGLCVK